MRVALTIMGVAGGVTGPLAPTMIGVADVAGLGLSTILDGATGHRCVSSVQCTVPPCTVRFRVTCCHKMGWRWWVVPAATTTAIERQAQQGDAADDSGDGGGSGSAADGGDVGGGGGDGGVEADGQH